MNSWLRRDFVKALLTVPLAITGSARFAEAQYVGPAASRPQPILGHTNPREAPFTAMGDGSTDDTKAIQGAIDAAIIKYRGGGVFVPAGDYRVSKTLHIENVSGLKFSGVSVGATRFIWNGPPDVPMFLLTDARDVLMSDFRIVSSSATPLYTGIQIENGAKQIWAPSQNHFQRIIINGTNKGGLTNGFRVAKGAGGDNNNDFHEFIRCQVRNYQGYGFSIEHSQSHTNRFYSCTFSGYEFGRAGVRTTHGSFSWYGGGGGGNTVADFVLGSPNVLISIINGNFENSARLLTTKGPTGARWPIHIQGVRYTAAKLAEDEIMINVKNPGPLILENNLFGTNTLPHMPRVRLESTQTGATFVSQGNLWLGQDAYDKSPYIFSSRGGTSLNAKIESDSFVGKGDKDVTVFENGDTKPTTHFSKWFQTRNTQDTTITHLRNGWAGAQRTILINDDNTNFDFKSGNLRGNAGQPWHTNNGDTMNCLFDGAHWRCQPNKQ
jgi:hypothetical protein